ncbi:hypothetical protein ALC62_09795 [Cyphomyrmex costatus]|uniref:SANTA domain-containing protein n=1 Tax=Cyphomyrmex costatus TaxID=456900 RepID=A0A195CH90_9HYME|nr:hypothetical protein ALC62_09795 [Cyphomyrmex costatus]
MTTSSVKAYNDEKDYVDRLTMPPPLGNTIYRTVRESQDRIALSNYKDVSLSDSSICSTMNTYLRNAPTISSNTDDKATVSEYQETYVLPSLIHDSQKKNRVFSKWKVMLNSQYELLIKGTLECGKIARSKPVIRRYSEKCVESKYKNVYILAGNIIDERNGLPDYIRGKFYNGFPDDWENVYQLWRTYVEQGCSVTFRWPTPITDSDDDLKSELTDMTHAYVKNKTITSATKSCIPSFEKNSFIKPFTPFYNTEKGTIAVVQTTDMKSLCDESNKQNFKLDINSPCNSRKVDSLKDILQEDKLNMIINNLADKNCSLEYVNNIVKMLGYVNYAVSYRSESECDNDSISTNNETHKSEAMSIEKSLVCDNNSMNTNKLRNKPTELKSSITEHSIDPGYGSRKTDSNSILPSNASNFKPEYFNNLDKSESEIYAGMPKISIEQVLKTRNSPRKIYKRKVRRKTTYPYTREHVINLTHNTKETKSIHMATNENQKLLSNETYINTENEVETMHNMRKCHKSPISSKSQEEMTFSNDRKMNRNHFEIYDKGKSVTLVQNKHPINAFDAQKNNASQFVSDIDYTINSHVDIDVDTVNSCQTAGGSVTASQAKVSQDIVATKKSNVSSKLHRDFIEQTKNDIVVKSKPTIISSVPVNFKLILSKEKFNKTAEQLPFRIINNDEQNTDIQLLENVNKKFMSKTSNVSKSVVNDSHKKTIVNNPVTNNNKLHNLNSINPTIDPTTEQPKKPSKEQNGIKKTQILTAWIPNVVYYAESKSKLGLTFQGRLVNEAGYITHRKYMTDIVLKRLSSRLIETMDHEIYELSGDLNDNKHIIPKELVKQCRYGCPLKIEQFCLTWKTLQQNNVEEIQKKFHDAPVSSRGRRILPPLSYWTGERILLKDNNPFYNPGNSFSSQKSSFLQINNSRKIQKNTVDIARKTNEQIMPKSMMTSDINKNQFMDSFNLNDYVRSTRTNKNVNSNPQCTMTLRKRSNVTYNYYKDVMQSEDFLSENENSFA